MFAHFIIIVAISSMCEYLSIYLLCVATNAKKHSNQAATTTTATHKKYESEEKNNKFNEKKINAREYKTKKRPKSTTQTTKQNLFVW